MKRAAIWLLAWGVWLGILTAVQAVFAPKLIQFAIPAVASMIGIAAGLTLWASDAHGPGSERPRLISDTSFATVTLVAGAALVLLGGAFGLWLILIGVGIATVGLGGIVREQRARGRAIGQRSGR